MEVKELKSTLNALELQNRDDHENREVFEEGRKEVDDLKQ